MVYEIRIEKGRRKINSFFPYFFTTPESILGTHHLHFLCPECFKMLIDDNYIKIIQELKKAGLLSEDYPILCCKCYHEGKHYG